MHNLDEHVLAIIILQQGIDKFIHNTVIVYVSIRWGGGRVWAGEEEVEDGLGRS